MGKWEELRKRVEARVADLEARVKDAEANAMAKTSEATKRVKQRLAEIQEYVRAGWEQMSDAVADRINEWLKKRDPS